LRSKTRQPENGIDTIYNSHDGGVGQFSGSREAWRHAEIDPSWYGQEAHTKSPAIVANYLRLVIFEDGDLQSEDDEGQYYLRYV
jgi:hypothetical protein